MQNFRNVTKTLSISEVTGANCDCCSKVIELKHEQLINRKFATLTTLDIEVDYPSKTSDGSSITVNDCKEYCTCGYDCAKTILKSILANCEIDTTINIHREEDEIGE